VLGALLGTRLAAYLAGVYLEFFRFPELPVRFYPSVFAFATALGVASALAGALGALRRLLALPPAEAMRPEPPAIYAHGIAERFVGRRLRSPVAWMVLRGLTHRPWRTALSAFGIGLGASVVVAGTFGFDSVAHMRRVLFGVALRADVTVVFADAQGMPAVHALARLPGVERVEPVREVAVRVRHGHRSRQTALVGVDTTARLRAPARIDARVGRVVPGGITLSGTLARVLDAGVGDSVDVEFLDGRRRRVTLPVSGTIDDLSGASLYVEAGRLPDLSGVGEVITAADLAVAPAGIDSLYARLTRTPGVRSIAVREALERSFDETLRQNFVIVLVTLVVFASALAAGTVYNAGRVTLSERTRDLASLRVLGFTRGEAARMFFGELVVLGAVGLPVGTVIGVGFAWATVASFGNTELFRLPLVIGPRTIAAGLLLPTFAALLVAYPLRRRLDRLDLISVLKTRE
jgi:putative ABC transport system permease protein